MDFNKKSSNEKFSWENKFDNILNLPKTLAKLEQREVMAELKFLLPIKTKQSKNYIISKD